MLNCLGRPAQVCLGLPSQSRPRCHNAAMQRPLVFFPCILEAQAHSFYPFWPRRTVFSVWLRRLCSHLGTIAYHHALYLFHHQHCELSSQTFFAPRLPPFFGELLSATTRCVASSQTDDSLFFGRLSVAKGSTTPLHAPSLMYRSMFSTLCMSRHRPNHLE